MKTTFRLVMSILSSCLAFAQPYQPEVIWDRSGLTDSSAYGWAVLPLGDQNNDGYADWAVYAQGNNNGHDGTQASYLEFFYGSDSMSAQPAFLFREDSTVYSQLWYADVVGDINGDGYMDWMIGFWPVSHPPVSTKRIFFGGAGFDTEPGMEWTIHNGVGLYPLCNFYGQGSGDFNGDGFDDLFEYDFFADIARIFYGGNPVDTVADWVLLQPPPGILQTIPYAVGDFTGDGASDFILYNLNNSQLDIFLGGTTPDTLPDYVWNNAIPLSGGVKSLNGDNADEFLLGLGVHFGRESLFSTPDYVLNSSWGGYPVSAGDFNGDGYNDMIMYAQTAGTPFGALDLHLGHPWLNPDPVFTIEGDTPPFNLRGIFTAAGLGDVNGDGLGDFAIGVWNETFGPWRGRCVIFSGDTLVASADNPRPEIAQSLSLEVYPNPFNSSTTIRWDMPTTANLLTLTIVNVLGQELRHEVRSPTAGEHIYRFNAEDLANGLYLAHLQCGDWQANQKLMLLK